MGDQLKAELKQRKPFSSLAEEALLNLERTADRFRRALQQKLKPHGITMTQYNALRILRGALPQGLPCAELGQRLVSSDPDITRLLDRLAREGLVQRKRAAEDKRVVLTQITDQGMALLYRVVPLLDKEVQASLAHLPAPRLHLLFDLLEEARQPLLEAGSYPESKVKEDEVA